MPPKLFIPFATVTFCMAFSFALIALVLAVEAAPFTFALILNFLSKSPAFWVATQRSNNVGHHSKSSGVPSTYRYSHPVVIDRQSCIVHWSTTLSFSQLLLRLWLSLKYYALCRIASSSKHLWFPLNSHCRTTAWSLSNLQIDTDETFQSIRMNSKIANRTIIDCGRTGQRTRRNDGNATSKHNLAIILNGIRSRAGVMKNHYRILGIHSIPIDTTWVANISMRIRPLTFEQSCVQ